MSDLLSERFEVINQKARQEFISKVRKEVLSLIYTGLVPATSKYSKKENISDEIVAYFYELNENMMYSDFVSRKKKVSDGIYFICLMPNFDGKKGYVIFFDPDSLLTSKMFVHQKHDIGRARCSYDILKGKIKKPSAETLEIIKKMVSDKKMRGPTITDKMEMGQIYDRQKWFHSFDEGDSVDVVYDNKHGTNYNLLLESSAKRSSYELYKIIEKNSGKVTMKSLVGGGKLSHYYNVHIKNSKRNNERGACEWQRFLQVMLKTDKDRYSYVPKDERCCTARVAISKTVQYENNLCYLDIDHADYSKYLAWMTTKTELGMYSHSKPLAKKCMAYFCGTNYFPLFRKRAVKKKCCSWKTWVKLNRDGKQFAFLDLAADDLTERFISVPPSIALVDDLSDRRKRKRRMKRRKRKRKRKKRRKKKQKSLVVIVEDPSVIQKPMIDEEEEEKDDNWYKQMLPHMFVFSKIGGDVRTPKLEKIVDKDSVYKYDDEISLDSIPGSKKKIESKLYNSYLSFSVTEK